MIRLLFNSDKMIGRDVSYDILFIFYYFLYFHYHETLYERMVSQITMTGIIFYILKKHKNFGWVFPKLEAKKKRLSSFVFYFTLFYVFHLFTFFWFSFFYLIIRNFYLFIKRRNSYDKFFINMYRYSCTLTV